MTAAGIARDETDGGAGEEGDEHAHDGDLEIGMGRHDHPREHVPAEIVGAEPVAEARRQQGLAEVDGQRIEGQKQGSEGGHHAQQRQHDGTGQERAVAPEAAERLGAEADHDSFTRGSAMA